MVEFSSFLFNTSLNIFVTPQPLANYANPYLQNRYKIWSLRRHYLLTRLLQQLPTDLSFLLDSLTIYSLWRTSDSFKSYQWLSIWLTGKSIVLGSLHLACHCYSDCISYCSSSSPFHLTSPLFTPTCQTPSCLRVLAFPLLLLNCSFLRYLHILLWCFFYVSTKMLSYEWRLSWPSFLVYLFIYSLHRLLIWGPGR